MASMLKRHDMDMTEGGIPRQLIRFAAPMFVGFAFQQLYNTVDSIVVGNFVGKEALAAVGSVSSIINTLIGFFLGLGAGASVVVAQYYGARDDKNLHKAVQTTVLMTLVLSVVATGLGVLLVPPLLRLMDTPEDVFDGAAQYLRIYFYGVSGLMFYNMGRSILQAVGDSRRPLIFLIISAVTNTVLDLIFVVWFHWGIAGVAIATVIAQALSAILVFSVLTRTDAAYRVVWKKLKYYHGIFKQILGIGLPSALQQALTSFSNVFVQSYVNRFGSAAMAGWSSYAKIDALALLPMMALSMAATTFVGQNLGAGKIKRAKRGIGSAMWISLVVTAVIIIPLMVFSNQLVALFHRGEDVIRFGTLFIRVMSPFYLLCAVNQVLSSTLRGAGDTRTPTVIMLFSFVVLRQIYLYVTWRYIGTIVPVSLAYPAGWVMCSLLLVWYYRSGKWERKRILVADSVERDG